MKKFFTYLGTGALFFLMSIAVACFGTAAYFGFTAIVSCAGWESVGLCLASMMMVFMAGFGIYLIGAIPLSSINDLKFKLKEQEENAERDYEALYKAATYDYKNKR